VSTRPRHDHHLLLRAAHAGSRQPYEAEQVRALERPQCRLLDFRLVIQWTRMGAGEGHRKKLVIISYRMYIYDVPSPSRTHVTNFIPLAHGIL
jgi:hypothetical protein